MWPLISPASGAPVSFIFDLIRLWPVFHISGLPPSSAMRSNRIWLALTSAMMVAPGSSFSTGSARIISSWSPQITRPLPSTAPMRSPSPSKAMPKSSCLSRDKRLEVGEIGFDGRIGMVVGEGAVDLGEDHVMLPGQPLDEHVEDGPAAPLPASQPMRNGLPEKSFEQPVDIGFADVDLLDRAVAVGPVARGGAPAERLDLLRRTPSGLSAAA